MSCWTWLRSSLYYLCGGSFYELIYAEIAMFISVMKLDAYYVPPFLYPCFDQACLWERVRGNVCISWSNGGGVVISWQLNIVIHWVFTLLCCLTRDKPKYHVARLRSDKPLPMTRSIMFLFSLYVINLKAILWVILITEVLWFSSHLGGV